MNRRSLILIAAACLAATAAALAVQTPDATALQAADPPPNGIWIDSLDSSAVAATALRRPGRAGRAGTPAPTPPPAPVYALGGVTYAHAIPMISDRDLSIDLKKSAVRFASMVGIDSSVAAGRGSVVFGVWVDGKKVEIGRAHV